TCFFSSRRRHTTFSRDWSSDVCSSDLTAHRAQASTHGVAKFAPEACAGPLLAAELDALGKALDHPAKPVVAIVGGSKVSTKLDRSAERRVGKASGRRGSRERCWCTDSA